MVDDHSGFGLLDNISGKSLYKCENMINPTANQDYVTLAYHNSHISYSALINIDNVRGSNCSGTDGNTDRILTLSNGTISSKEMIWNNGLMMHSADVTISSASLNSTVTFINPVWDTDY